MLEYVEGPHLSSLLRNYEVALDQTLAVGLQLCSAVHYLGRRAVVHLDVKPRNIIMAGPPRLIDFSLALHTSALAAVSAPLGTATYMAPEQCDPARFCELGSAADVWGIGVTLYWALAAHSPFPEPALEEDASPELRYPQLVNEPQPLSASVPPALAELIGAMLAPRAGAAPEAGAGRGRPGAARGGPPAPAAGALPPEHESKDATVRAFSPPSHGRSI